MSDPREGEEFFLNVPKKLDNPFPDLKYFREHRMVPMGVWAHHWRLCQCHRHDRSGERRSSAGNCRVRRLDRAAGHARRFLMLSEKILGVWETISALPRVWECGGSTSTMERV
jgi:hypothetical protein